ncbi:hypothetical protein CDD83_8638 [Cordyceps sp. RAO-2017]|nr:hypothetical protein CDD83_8638 [Cordyceps sp. RAO-2017]
MDRHTSAVWAVAAGLLLVLALVVVQRAYPRPLPGIPYNRAATRRLWGDLPEIAEAGSNGGSFRTWFLTQAIKHNSAITQVFLGPLVKPSVIVSDYREVSDILKHRDAVDFKRGLKVQAFRGLLPHAFPAMETFDAGFKRSRDLARDLMAPSVLHAMNAPRVHEVASDLVQLWRLKCRLAEDHPFDLTRDLCEFSFDAILSAAMGLDAEGGDVKRQLERMRSCAGDDVRGRLSPDTDDPVVFESGPKSAKLAALQEQVDSLWKAFAIPWPRLYHSLNNLRPRVRAARATLQKHIVSQAALARERLTRDGQEPRCALDFVIQREMRAAARERRVAVLDDPHILQPIHGYLIAGHDTSAGSLSWLMRRLVLHPEQQALVRDDLRRTYAEARAARRPPTAAELVGGRRCARLEAFVQETLRLDTPVLNIMVMTRTEAVVLGHRLPADTRVFVNLTGPSINMPSLAVDEERRSPTSRAHKSSGAARDNWDDADPAAFRPERWLRPDADGKPVYDAGLGPELAFSAGNRGCWGKRLGNLELRIVLALLIWSFEFELPRKFVSWDTYDSLVTAPKACLVRIKELP